MTRSRAFHSKWAAAPHAVAFMMLVAEGRSFGQPGPNAPASEPPPAPSASPSGTATPPDTPPDGPREGSDTAGSKPVDSPDATGETPPPASSTDSEWAQRDRDINESATLTGGSGLLRTQHAETGAPGQFRLGFVAEWFSAGFLCSPQFPCANPQGGPNITSDTLNHIGGTLTLGVSIAKLGSGTLEGYAATVAYANSDNADRTPLLQVLGDTDLGVKYVAPLGDVVRLGLFTELQLVNGLGSVGLDDSGTGARFGGVGTIDLRGLSSPAPLRFSANVAYVLDNTGEVISGVEQAQGQPISRIERYGLGINRVDHVDFLIGAEALLAEERVRPFLEARIQAPTNRQGFVCNPVNPSNDGCLKNDAVVPTILTLGSRFFPWKRGFSLLAALDIGLSGQSDFIEEVQPVAPWTLFLGAGWAVDTTDRPATVKTVESATPRTVRIVGFVHEKDKTDPVAGAIVSYTDHPELSPLATAADGKFGDDVLPGTYTFEIHADGFKPGTCPAETAHSSAAAPSASADKGGGDQPSGGKPASDTSGGKPASDTSSPAATDSSGAPPPSSGRAEVDIDCPLEALPKVGTVTGTVRDADTGQALSGIQAVLTDSAHKELRLLTNGTGAFHFDGVAPGTAQISIVADGYLAMVAPADVKARQDSAVDLLLRPKPKHPSVQVTAKEITIRDQIQFALDSSVILPQSFGLLTEVADTLIRHPEIRRVEVQGHTDNSGTPDHNRTLSEERAQAVQAWLVQHGVPADKLVAHGYGQEKPLVPNVTPAMRAQNRRVQFIILDQDAAGAAAAPGPTGASSPPAAGGGPGAASPAGGGAGGGAAASPAPGGSAAPPPPVRKPNPLPGF
jgi:outer membrane protein OmpA-like peptidoglycan-associated protein